MTAQTSIAPQTGASSAPSRTRPELAPVPLRRLVAVELRKSVDTRVGFWLLAGAAALIAITLAVGTAVTEDPADRSFASLLTLAQLPMSAVLPIIGILAATGEWSHRTVLQTYAVTPSRTRVLGAKTLAALVIACGSLLVTLVLAAVAAAAAPLIGDTTADWSVGISDVGEFVTYQALYMLVGVGLGTLLLSAPAAIVLFLVLPLLWMGLTGAFPGLDDIRPWVDTGTSWEQLVAGGSMTSEWWARIFTTALVWLGIPFAVGTWRVLRREVD